MTWREFENLVHRKLLSLGWRVQRETPAPDGWSHGRAYWDAAYIRRLGFSPGTIIDIGVAHGTGELYRAFPGAFLLLVEPLAEFAPDIATILAARPGSHVPVALGANPRLQEIRVEPRQLLLSSLYRRQSLEQTGDYPFLRSVTVETLDRVTASATCPRPFGLKIDAEGAELEILRGAASTLADTQFLIVETSVPRRFDGSYCFVELIAELDARGFEVIDILDIGRASTSQVIFFDLVFGRKQ